MIDGYPIVVYLNGEPLKCRVDVHHDQLERSNYINIGCPDLAAAVRLLPDVRTAPTLDHVMFNWRNHDTQASNNPRHTC